MQQAWLLFLEYKFYLCLLTPAGVGFDIPWSTFHASDFWLTLCLNMKENREEFPGFL